MLYKRKLAAVEKLSRMENLIQELKEKHQLNKAEAVEAIRMVAEYLKGKNPALQHLIDAALMENNTTEAEQPKGT